MKVNVLTDSYFEQKVKNSKGKVFIDCYADWCGPCKMMAPVVDEVAEEVDSCTFYKLNVDENPNVSSEFNIMSIPTFLLFQEGELVKVEVGMQSKESLINFINN